MSTPIGSSQWMYSSGVEFSIDQSLRFNDADNHYLNHVASTGDSQKWTWSGWVKRGNLGTLQAIFSEGATASSFALYFNTTDTLYAQERNSSSNRFLHATDAVFRDVGAWYHIVYAVDTTQATDSDRVNLYVNGQIQTLAAVSGSIYPSLNLSTNMNVSGRNNLIGYAATNSFKCLDGYLAEVNFVDGQQLNATDFAEDNNGQWLPLEYSGSYGVNGYYLTFSLDSFTDNASDPDVFADQSGSNNYDAYNFKASDVVLDSPTNNFATFNPLDQNDVTGLTYPTVYSEGNLKLSQATGFINRKATFGMTGGKWYWEIKINDSSPGSFFGVSKSTGDARGALDNDEATIRLTNGNLYTNGAETSYGTAFSNGDVCMLAVDMDAGKFWAGRNGTWFASGDPAAGTNEGKSGLASELFPSVSLADGENCDVNFGQNGTFNGTKTAGGNSDGGYGDFLYTVPSGFLALCTSNLPDITIGPGQSSQADDYFNSVLYTGDGTSSNAITGIGHQPDFLWIKNRDAAVSHVLQDSVRGIGSSGVNFNTLISDSTGGEFNQADADGVSSFDADGFTVGYTNSQAWNENATTYVGWSWKAGGSSNTFNIDGTGYSTASAAGLTGGNIAADAASISKTSGISILKYTGDGSSSPYSTIKHGLDSPPEFYICKSLDSGNADNWVFFHTLVNGSHDYMYLDLPNDNSNSAINFPPTATTVKVGGNAANENNKNFLMIAGHSVEGFSKFDSYVGNGDPDGTFVYTGFRPAWVMVKGAGNTYSWYIHDSTRDTFNHTDAELAANSSSAEYSAEGAGGGERSDFLSNGFKVRTSNVGWNQSGITYIYLAFAEMPFKYANAR